MTVVLSNRHHACSHLLRKRVYRDPIMRQYPIPLGGRRFLERGVLLCLAGNRF